MHCITKDNTKSKREEKSKGMILTYLKPSIEKGKYSWKLCACWKNLDIFKSDKNLYKNSRPQRIKNSYTCTCVFDQRKLEGIQTELSTQNAHWNE